MITLSLHNVRELPKLERNVSVKQPILMGTVISTSPKKTPVNPSLG